MRAADVIRVSDSASTGRKKNRITIIIVLISRVLLVFLELYTLHAMLELGKNQKGMQKCKKNVPT